MERDTKEKFTEPAATKLTPSQVALIEMARMFARLMNDPEFQFKGEREGQGDLAAFYREGIMYYCRAIMVRAKTTLAGKDLVDWAMSRVAPNGLEDAE